jgi:hypothetical protein
MYVVYFIIFTKVLNVKEICPKRGYLPHICLIWAIFLGKVGGERGPQSPGPADKAGFAFSLFLAE